MRAGYFTFGLGLVIYYSILLNTVFPFRKNSILMSFIYATVMFVWPIPVGLVWMLFLFKLAYPFIARLFYTNRLPEPSVSFWLFWRSRQ